ncbi:MAG: glycosyltransferase [Gemmatimonadaceae bacterium]
MLASPLRVCLVTSAHVSNNPRLVKEADALLAAGHAVRVVAMKAREDLSRRDDALMRGRGWELRTVAAERHGAPRSAARWLAGALTQKGARALHERGLDAAPIRDRAASRHLAALAAAAAERRADVVIGHNLAALPAAARAARRLGASLGFDVEDLHVEELPDDAVHAAERGLIEAVERQYIPRCTLLSAASDGIADEIARRYGVERPRVVHNVFPPLAAPDGDGAESGLRPADTRPAVALSLYWYSQVIGHGRGIEDAVAALALLGRPALLHLRGELDPAFASRLQEVARKAGVEQAVRILPPAPADDLVALAAEHDVGLALEVPRTLNRALCVTNKVFTYLAAGVAVAATGTPGQRAVLERCGEAAILYPSGHPELLAEGLRRWADSPPALARARAAAAAAARETFSWERDAAGLVEFIECRVAAARADRVRGVAAAPGAIGGLGAGGTKAYQGGDGA